MERFSGKTCVGLISLAVIVTIPLAFFPHTAWTAQYTFTTLKHPSAMNDIYATGLNNSGQVTGYYYEGGITYGFVYSSGDFTTLYGPFAFATYAFGINNNGEVTGYYADSKWGYHGFVYSGSDFNTLDVLYAYYTSAFGINNNGDVTGYYADSNWGWHGFVYSGGDFNKLDVPYARNTYATGINDSGQVTGYYEDASSVYHGFVYSGGVFRKLDVPYARNTYATGINDSGEVTGYYADASKVYHGFVYSGSDFSTLDVPSARYTYAFGINNSGQVIGSYGDGTAVYGFIATPVSEVVASCQDVTVAAGSSCSTNASIDNGSYDPGGYPITLTQSPAGPYPKGNTLVTLTVTDSQGASSQCTGTVTVIDQTPPAIAMASINPSMLWPANHKMVPVRVTASAFDNCGIATCMVISVTSNEPINGLGDGDTAPDWKITGDLTVNLRAERSGSGSGRIYTITVNCTDGAGNSSGQAVTVGVPKDQQK